MTSKIKVDNISDQNDNNIINESGDVITVGASGDTVAVAGNIVKSNALQASDGGNIVNQSGTTITIGASGDTVSLASGASQSGFGRSGSVDWQTGSIKTSTFTAADGEGYFVDTSSGAVEVDLPAGSAGAIVAINDYASTAATNNITIDSNGSEKIMGSTENHLINTNGVTVTLVYVDGVQGWKLVDTGESASFPQVAKFTQATGGTVTTVCTNFKVHTFTGPGTFCVSQVGNAPANPSGGPANASFLVVAGGGGGQNGGGAYGGGGGGAGGFRTDHPCAAGTIPITATAFPIQVGGGGAAQTVGTPSIFSTITSTGGGSQQPGCTSIAPGGSGAGSGKTKTFGTGNTPPVSPPQGRNGGGPPSGSAIFGGGGGGHGCAGDFPGPGNQFGANGGVGTANTITGSSVTYAGGGGGGASTWACGSPIPKDGGTGGSGIGGDGGNVINSNPVPATINGVAGTTNRGGGGGGGGWCSGGPTGPSPLNQSGTGGAGGSGIVIIRYKFQ